MDFLRLKPPDTEFVGTVTTRDEEPTLTQENTKYLFRVLDNALEDLVDARERIAKLEGVHGSREHEDLVNGMP